MYIGLLERFGYTLMVVGKTEAEARDSLMKEYSTAYFDRNRCRPSKKEKECARSEIYLEETAFGSVIWC